MISLYPTKNRSLARIAATKRDSWLEIKTPQLPKTLRSELHLFYQSISGEPMPDELTTLLCAFDKQTKTYVRTYAPAIYTNSEGLAVIVWGNIEYPLTNELIDALDVEVQIVELEKYKETCLVFNTTNEAGDLIELPLQLRINADNRDIKLAEIKKIVKGAAKGANDIQDIAKILYVRETKEGGGGDFQPTLKLSELDESTEYAVLAYEYKDFGSHTNYILTIDYNGEERQCYAPSVVRSSLDAGAELTDDTFFEYITRTNKKGKVEYIVGVENLDWPEGDEEFVTF